MWKTKEIDKGRHPDTQKIEFEFEYEGVHTIKSASGSCGCTTVQIDGNKVKGTIVPKKIADVVPSMVTKKEYNTEQTISVTLSDNSFTVLRVKALIVEG